MGRARIMAMPEKEEKDRRRKGEKEDDGFSFVCSICKDFGELLCCDRCRDSFHLSCLGFEKCPDTDPWLCSTCSQNKVRCFECKSFGTLEDDLVQCTYRGCSKYYHKDCMKNWRQKKTSAAFAMVCPRHDCDVCVDYKIKKWSKLYRCLHCPVAYHEACAPDGINLLEDIPGYMICSKHDDEWKHENQDAEPSRDPKISFERLPLPTIAHDFQIPRAIFEDVRRMPIKPPSYCHIRRNIYLVKRSKKWQQDDRMECLCKPTTGSSGACSKDCLCGILFVSCSSSCGCGDSCTNLPFQKRPGSKMKAIKTEKCGWGLVADEDIKAGSFLIEYVGEVIDDKTCEERLWVMKKQGEMNFYMCEISREMVIDATFKGNLSRYINHSCHPNSELQKWEIEGEIRIGVFAIEDIKRGTWITYDYQLGLYKNFLDWEVLRFIQFGTDQHCHCGASDCRGQLGKPMKKQKTSEEAADSVPQTLKKSNLCGNFSLKHAPLDHMYKRRKSLNHVPGGGEGLQSGNSKEMSLVGLRVRIWWPLDQKYYHGQILSFNGNSGMHEICYDDGEKEAVCLAKERWEVENVGKSKRRKWIDSSSTSDVPSVLNGDSDPSSIENAINSGINSTVSGDITSKLPVKAVDE